MRLKALACIPLGHRWTTASDSFDAELLLHCTRCGRTRDMGSETRDKTPWTGRSASPTGMMGGGTGRDGRPY